MAWSSFAHLPTSREEYIFILSRLRNGMSLEDVDKIIAKYKNKHNVQYHYRNNLARINLFAVINKQIKLNYDPQIIPLDNGLQHVLSKVVFQSKIYEVDYVLNIIIRIGQIDLPVIVLDFASNFPYLDKKSIIRWIRPIVQLIIFTGIIESGHNNRGHEISEVVQNAFLSSATGFGETISIESLEQSLGRYLSNIDMSNILSELLKFSDNRYKIELLMLPNWATKSKSYKINNNYYTHIKVKTDLLRAIQNEE